MDLSRSAANFKTPANTASRSVSQSYQSSSCGVLAASNTRDALSLCFENLVSSSASHNHNSLTFPAACASNLVARASSMNRLPCSPAHRISTVPNSDMCQNSIARDILSSAVTCRANYDAMVKSDPLSSLAASSCNRVSAGNLGYENDSCLQYPKTKKQRAVDSKTLHAEVRASSSTSLLSLPAVDGHVSEYEALTFGEIQERLITKVVESGSLSGVLSDGQPRVVGSNEHCLTGLLAGKSPIGRYSHCKTSPVQSRVSVAMKMAPSECHKLHVHGAGSLPRTSVSEFPREQQSFATTTRGLWFRHDV